ncbi:MAG: MAPEG family protein [Wenzhouxiangellaceae bacterium]
MNTLPITSIYAAVFGLILLPITIRVGLRRLQTQIFFLDGGDEILLRRIRSHANFLEYVPITLILLGLCEAAGASASYLHGLGGVLLVSRLMHYFTLNINPVANTRALSMLGTFAAMLMGSGWLLYHAW